MGEGEDNLTRLEFEHFIAEFEGFRDVMMDEISNLKHDIEIIKDKIDDLRSESISDTAGAQNKLL